LTTTTNDDIERILGIMTLATGDEKHDPSAYSTLDVLAVLYNRVLRFNPAEPHWEGRDRFVLSKGHGPLAFYAILADKGFFPPEALKQWLLPGGASRPAPGAGRRGLHRLARPRPADGGGHGAGTAFQTERPPRLCAGGRW
jgi:transketolase N-terminal domain/subunit